jgi:hypothetical protein
MFNSVLCYDSENAEKFEAALKHIIKINSTISVPCMYVYLRSMIIHEHPYTDQSFQDNCTLLHI